MGLPDWKDVVVTRTSRTSAATAPEVKSKSKQVIDKGPASSVELQDEDDSHEKEAALASPIKGSESQKMNKVLRFSLSLI